jgi:hypothetical protein
MKSGRLSTRGMQDTHARRGVAFGLPCRLRAGGCSRSARAERPTLRQQPPRHFVSGAGSTTRAKRVSAWINGVKSEVKR